MLTLRRQHPKLKQVLKALDDDWWGPEDLAVMLKSIQRARLRLVFGIRDLDLGDPAVREHSEPWRELADCVAFVEGLPHRRHGMPGNHVAIYVDLRDLRAMVMDNQKVRVY